MKHLVLMTWIVAGLLATGCARITTQVVEKPRLDQELSGNRGTLAGSAPESSDERKETRQVLEINVDLATPEELNPWRVSEKPAAGPVSEPVSQGMPESFEPKQEVPMWMEPGPAPEMMGMELESTTYVVQKNDTLEKIAEAVYGDGKLWRHIYEANRDVLSSPNRIYDGQELVIPALPDQPDMGPGDFK